MAVFLSKFSGHESSIVKHDCGTAVAAFLRRTFGGQSILQSSHVGACFPLVSIASGFFF